MKKPRNSIEYQGFSELYKYCFVTRLGLEPKTPTLKVLCSTN